MAIPKHQGIPEVPLNMDSKDEMRQFLINLRQSVVNLRGPATLPTAPSNLKATALAFAVLLQWTNGINSDGTEVLWNTTPTLQGAHIIDAGSSNEYKDYVGNANVKRYYWVRSYDAHSQPTAHPVSSATGPVSATTLASGTGVTPPVPPVPGQSMALDALTQALINTYSRGGGF